MAMIEVSQGIALKEILYLTDFSPASKEAMPFAMALARRHGATVRALHVVVANRNACLSPELKAELVRADRVTAQMEMQGLDSEMQGIAHQAKLLVREEKGVWPAVEEALSTYHSDLIVVGTHGYTGAAKNWFGSTAEEIFRRSAVPVLTIGPRLVCGVSEDDRFHRLLVATNFEPECNAAVQYAGAIADEDRAQLLLMHVINWRQHAAGFPSVAETMHKLHELIPQSQSWFRSEAIVRFGEPWKRIIETAKDRCADLIMLGVRDHAADLEFTTHFDTTTAYRIVVAAPCPVLTVRAPLAANVTAAERSLVN